MARRLKYLALLRKAHFIAGIIVFMTLLMYAFSGFVMTQHKWFPEGKISSDTNEYQLNNKLDTTDLPKLAKQIKSQFELSGRAEFHRNYDNSITFIFSRPGNFYSVLIYNKLDTVKIIRHSRASFYEINKRLHRIHGFSGRWPYVVWAILLDATGIGAIIFAITGVLIWLRNHRLFRLGWLLIIPPFILMIVMIIYLF